MVQIAGRNVTTDKILKAFGLVACVIAFSVAYSLGEKAQTSAQKNMVKRLDLTRNRYQNCQTEIKMMRGEMKMQIDTEVQLAQEEHEALKQENELFTEDNQILREENYQLEEQIDALRDELNEQDFVVDADVEPLQELADLGNNTEALKEVLEEAEMDGQVSKDELLSRLVSEIKVKRIASRQCRAKLSGVVQQLKQLSGKDYSELVTEVFGEWDEYLRYKGSKEALVLTGQQNQNANQNQNQQRSGENERWNF